MWINHIKEFAKKHNMSYGCAMTDPRCKEEYQKKKKPKLRQQNNKVIKALDIYLDDDQSVPKHKRIKVWLFQYDQYMTPEEIKTMEDADENYEDYTESFEKNVLERFKKFHEFKNWDWDWRNNNDIGFKYKGTYVVVYRHYDLKKKKDKDDWEKYRYNIRKED